MALLEPEDNTSELSVTLVPTDKDYDQASTKSRTSKSVYSSSRFSPFENSSEFADKNRAPKYEPYRSTTADIKSSYFKIGPFVYGGEIQDVKILEQKAVMTVPSTRGGQDFLVDGGQGEADILVSMVFSGVNHIKKALVPLIALFRLSPITSVDNSFIKSALYDKFTENDSDTPSQLASEKADKLWYAIHEARAHYDVMRKLSKDGKPSRHRVTPIDFENAINQGIIEPPFGVSKYNYLYTDWLEAVSRPSADTDSVPFEDNSKQTPSTKYEDIANANIKIDKTGHVPVAMVNITISTHPELPDSLLVNLTLRRVNVGNYLRNFLQYRTIDNTPTSDPRNAYWLLRAIDKYVEKYYKEPLLSSFGKVKLSFAGDDVILSYFAQQNNLVGFDLNEKNESNDPTKTTGSCVTQLSYSISNKFAFHRLAGEAYPTAQHMGISSGNMTISIKTNDPDKFEQLHTYKNAADFFMRAVDKINRFNGWSIKCILTELFNVTEYSNSTKNSLVRGSKVFYPLSIASGTNPESPGLRDIAISLSETSLDFFSEFGFALYTNGMTIDTMYQFYNQIIQNLDRVKFGYNFDLFYGSGDQREKYSLLNPDSIIAAFLENETVVSTEAPPGQDQAPRDISIQIDKSYSARTKFLVDVAGLKVVSNELDVKSALDPITDLVLSPAEALAIKVGFRDGNTLSLETRLALIDENFNVDDPAARDTLIKAMAQIIDPEPRRALYTTIWNLVNTGKISFKQSFLTHLFVALLKRKQSPFSDRLYDRTNVANGYNSLERAIEVFSETIDATPDKKWHSEFVKSKAVSNALVYSPDGSFEVTKRRITAYPDYFYITYKELFDLPEFDFPFGEDNWKKFGYTFQDYGIIHPDPFAYNSDPSASLTANSAERAQSDLVTTAESPISPAVFFYRDTEMDKLRVGIDNKVSDWVNQLRKLTLKVPIDVEFMLQESGKFTGELGIYNEDGSIKPLQELTQAQIAKLIEVEERSFDNIEKSPFNLNAFGDSARAILKYQHNKAYFNEQLRKKYSITDRKDFTEKLLDARRKDPNKGLAADYDAIVRNFGDIEVALPIISTIRDPDSQISTRRLSGVRGAATVQEIITRGVRAENKSSLSDLTDDVIKEDASGQDGSIVLGSSSDEIQNGVIKTTQAIQDLRNDIIKAFPTFRLYIIDFNKGDRIFVKDNFYGYNAIESIDITLDKNDADLAVIRVADPLGILQGSVLDDKLTWNKGYVSNVVLPTLKEGPVENYLARFELRQGRAIQIRGGYSADPDNLDILFTGRIAEVQFGDIVTIVAQGWKAEMLGKQVSFENTTVANSSVKDLVVRTIRDANPSGLGLALTYEELIELKQIGALVKLDDAIAKSIQNQYGTFGGAETAYAGLEGFTGFHWWGGEWRGADMRLKNIWIPDINKTRFNFMADISTTGWEGQAWVIPMQPAWEVLQNASNYLWGYVCQVVPYDGEATIFFGRPEQLYYYTRGNSRTATKYNKQIASGKDEFADQSSDIFQAFLGSTQYKNVNGWSSIVERGFTLQAYLSDKDTNLITVGIKPSDTVLEISPSEFSFVSFRKAFDFAMNYGAFDDEGDLLQEYIDNDLEDHQVWVGNVMVSDFSFVLDELANILGTETNAAMFLLTSFYGFSYKFINDSMFPPASTVRKLLRSTTPQQLRGISEEMINSLDSIESKEAAEETNIKGMAATEAQKFLKYLDESKDLIPQLRISSTDRAVELEADIEREYKISLDYRRLTSLDTNASSKLMEALAAYCTQKSTADNIFGFAGFVNAPAVIDHTKTALTITAILNTNVAPPTNNIITSLVSRARAYFNACISSPELQDGFDYKIFEKKFVDRSRNLISSAFQSVDGNPDVQDLREYVIETIPSFKAFAYFLAEYLKTQDVAIKDKIAAIQANNVFKFPPALNMKPFRDYHYVTNGVEIVQNSLAASTREMNNTVVIRGSKYVHTPNDWAFGWIPKPNPLMTDYDDTSIEKVEWATWPKKEDEGHIGWQFNDWISFSNKKIGVYTDININRQDQAAKVASNVLASYMRPMYRNNVLLLGRSIKPWDQVFIDDKYVDMLGMVEVERVVHHYSTSTGWLTNIVPHLIAEANPSSGMLQRAIIANQWDNIFNAIDMALWMMCLSGTGSFVKPVAGLLRSAAVNTAKLEPLAWTVKKFGSQGLKQWAAQQGSSATIGSQLAALRTTFAKELGPMLNNYLAYATTSYGAGEVTRLISANSTVRSRSDNFPVTITPLLFKGIPLEAGVNGQDVSYFSASSKFYWFYTDLAEGVRDAWRFATGFDSEPKTSQIQENLSQVRRGLDK